ncbi:sensor histidine kinase [Qipengyuania thermophila]|uniref:sensor histidine kinase n=1 Tax=Qipengyuania thermophila TaxID=2509361 RepID=UPI0013ED2533|nr:PAS domain-containing protein [Qipengyuania thermophila]
MTELRVPGSARVGDDAGFAPSVAMPAHSRDLLLTLVEQSRDCIKLVDLDGRLLFMNGNGRAAMGIERMADVEGAEWASLWPAESRAVVADSVRRAAGGEPCRFEGFCPTARGEERWWDVGVAPIRSDEGVITHILATSRDVTRLVLDRMEEQRRREAAEHEAARADTVAREMRHRFKNQLAVITSLLRLSARHAADVPDLVARFDQRLAALARAQDFMAADRNETMPASEVIPLLLRMSGAAEKVRTGDLTDALLGNDAIQTVALILGELLTNALKHGALAQDSGRIEVAAQCADGRLAVTWLEDAGHPVQPPERKGGGLNLLERMGAVTGARPEVTWSPTGLRVTFYVRATVPPVA